MNSATDHPGNVRVTFGVHSNGEPEVLQVTDYYPFGLVMAQQNIQLTPCLQR